MDDTSQNPDGHPLDELIAEAKQLLAKCDRYGLSLAAIDVSSAIDKMEQLLRGEGKD